MSRQSSRLGSSFKVQNLAGDADAFVLGTVLVPQAGELPPGAITPENTKIAAPSDHERWHSEVENALDVLEFLVTDYEYPVNTCVYLEFLLNRTATIRIPSRGVAQVVRFLINDHDKTELPSSPPVSIATGHILSPMNLDVERYLRCDGSGGQCDYPLLISGGDLQADHPLHALSTEHPVLQTLGFPINKRRRNAFAKFLLLPVSESALERLWIRPRPHTNLNFCLQQKQLLYPVFWLQVVSKAPNNDVATLLNRRSPPWLLSLLHEAQILWYDGLYLLILLCIYRAAAETALAMTAEPKERQDMFYCGRIFTLLLPYSPQSSLRDQIGDLIQYFPSPTENATDLFNIKRQWLDVTHIHRQIVSLLPSNGNTTSDVSLCDEMIKPVSTLSPATHGPAKAKTEPGITTSCFDSWLVVVCGALRNSRGPDRPDRLTLDFIRRIPYIFYPLGLRPTTFHTSQALLQLEDRIVLRKTRSLKTLRLKRKYQKLRQSSGLVRRLTIGNAIVSQGSAAAVPDELLDVVETVGEAEYELTFTLTGLDDLQRCAKGISKESRLLVVRLCLQGNPKFCIHFSPNDEGQDRHSYWQASQNREPHSNICTTKPNLFTYYVGRNLNQSLGSGQSSLKSVHSTILRLITTSPNTCIVCCVSMSAKLWKPAPCSTACSLTLRRSPLDVRLHNLLIDPLSIDLLLTSIYAAAADQPTTLLLPRCPVEVGRIRAVIDSFPPLERLQTAVDLQDAIQGDICGKERERLLSWLCLTFGGFIMKAPDSFHVPSMTNTTQFLMVNSYHEREAGFNAQIGPSGGSGVVFHGTRASRLFAIVANGLEIMSYGRGMLHGAARGAGIYCSDEQASSSPFAGSTSASWKNSKLGHMKIMLGCELANYVSQKVHCVDNKDRLAVRYIFLLPQNYEPPPRSLVEPVMKTAFEKLRSGLRT